MNSETEEIECDHVQRPDSKTDANSDQQIVEGGENSDGAVATTSAGIKNASMNLINFSPDKPSSDENAIASIATDMGEKIAEACGQIRISNDFDVLEEGYSFDDYNVSSNTDDSDVVLVAEYYYATESEMEQERNIKPEN